MPVYSNYHNQYQYGSNNNELSSNHNSADNHQPLQPPEGYVEASYNWNSQGTTSSVDNTKAYNNSNEAFSRSQDTSSSFTHLPAVLGGYNQTGENTQNPGGLNNLVYSSSLESAYLKNAGTSQPTKASAPSSTEPSQYQTTLNSYNPPPQNTAQTQSVDLQTNVNYSQQPQRFSSAFSQTTVPSYAHHTASASHDATKNSITQPEHQPSPKANAKPKVPNRVSNLNSPPNSHSSTAASLNAPAYSQTAKTYNSFPFNQSSVVENQYPVTFTEPMMTDGTRTKPPPTMTANQRNLTSNNSTNLTNLPSGSDMGTRAPNKASASKVQDIDPTDLFTQQYFLAQERARAAEENQRTAAAREETRAAGAPAAAANTQVTAASVANVNSTASKPTKNTSKKRLSKNKKAEETAPAAAAPPESGDDMAGEMRAMLEKLRGMRTKDPSLFAQLWDDFKKAPSSDQIGSTPPVAAVEQGPATSGQSLTSQSTAAEPINSKNNTDSLPDLGKFPAQRRRRNRKSDIAKTSAISEPPIPYPKPQVNVDSVLNHQESQQPPLKAFAAQHTTSVANSSPAVAQMPQQKDSKDSNIAQPKTTSAQDTAWPAATQQRLAEAASEHLREDPANSGKQCSPESLMLLLRNNPSYAGLCSQLESRGFVFSRRAMARFLLGKVPAFNSANNGQGSRKVEPTKSAPTTEVAQSLSITTHSPMLPRPSSATNPALPPYAAASITVPNILQPGPPVAQPPLPPPQVIELDINTGTSRTVPLAPPRKEKLQSLDARARRSDGQFASVPVLGPKAEMARKRFFSEIVDMTQVTSDEDEDMLSDEGNPLIGGANNFLSVPVAGRLPEFPGFGQDAMDLDTDSPNLTDHDLSDSRTAKEAEVPQLNVEFDPDDEVILRSIKKMPHLAKPLNSSAALNRAYYNPKSIARDIMIATGRHPTERPLNYHLMKVAQTFAGVKIKSDFETLKWDIIDPGGPSMPVVELEDILIEPPQITRKRRRRGDLSRDGEIRNGSTPDKQPRPPASSADTAPDSTVTISSVSTPLATRTPMAGTPTSSQRTGRRGRPPGAKNKKPTNAALKATADANPSKSVRIADSQAHPTVPEPSYPVFTCEWASCPAQLHDIHTLERHVFKVHISGQKACQWNDCPNSTTEYSSEALKGHLAKAHIQPLAWKYGDGPSVTGTGFHLDRYLNANGFIVTPNTSIAGDNDTLIFPVEQTPIRAFNRLYGEQKPKERAQQVLRAVQKRRKHVGIGLEQEGCEFSTPVRNKAFANDEEWYEVIAVEEDEENKADNWYSQADGS